MASIRLRVISGTETTYPSLSIEVTGARSPHNEGVVLARARYRKSEHQGFLEVHATDALGQEYVLGRTDVRPEDGECLKEVLAKLGRDLIQNRHFHGLARIANRY